MPSVSAMRPAIASITRAKDVRASDRSKIPIALNRRDRQIAVDGPDGQPAFRAEGSRFLPGTGAVPKAISRRTVGTPARYALSPNAGQYTTAGVGRSTPLS